MTLNNLKDLYIEELKDIYDAEKQLIKALVQLGEAAKNQTLTEAFEEHARQTQNQIERLEKIFEQLGTAAKGKPCKAMQGLVKEGKEMMEEDADPDVRDAGLIAAAQRAEHYEISAYGTVAAYAEILGRKDDLKLLKQTLKEEKATDEKLSRIARTIANPSAVDGTAKGSSEATGSMTKDDLYGRAQELNIPGRSKMGKEELARAIREHK